MFFNNNVLLSLKISRLLLLNIAVLSDKGESTCLISVLLEGACATIKYLRHSLRYVSGSAQDSSAKLEEALQKPQPEANSATPARALLLCDREATAARRSLRLQKSILAC